MKDTTEISRLIKKKLEGSITAQEQLILDKWAAASASNAKLLDDLRNEDLILGDLANWLELNSNDRERRWTDRLADATLDKIRHRDETHAPKVRRFNYRQFIPYAAALLVFFLSAILLLTPSKVETQVVYIEDLSPGKNRAQLTLADGQTISLSETQDGIILGDAVTYEDGSIISASVKEAAAQLELRTPRGGRYQVTLTDGTKVWLNADSKLSYPSKFTGDTRLVELEGEAYFEVSKSKTGQRFVVKTAQQEIEVLGTHFNVMAYNDEIKVQTTLAEGSVKVLSAGKELTLSPGEQSIFNGQSLAKRRVEVDQYLAWIHNEFLFDDTELKDVLKLLGRWYDFETVYEKNISANYLYGSISRSQSFNQVLKILESSGLKFRLEKHAGRNRLVVLK